MAIHHNGVATSVHISGIAGRHVTLQGPAFRLSLNVDDDRVVVDVEGRPAAEQVLRLLANQGALVGTGERIDVRIDTSAGYDRYVFTWDLEHRLLFTRVWDRRGLTGVFYGLNPFRGDTDGPVEKVPPRPSLRNIVGALVKRGPVARVDIMNVFTRRTPDAVTLLADLDDRVASPELEREVLAQVDYVVPAWGATVGSEHMPAVRDFLHVLDDIGKTPFLRAKHGQILTAGNPPQPSHARTEGYKQIELVPAPEEWLRGGHLPMSTSPTVRRVEIRQTTTGDLEQLGVMSASAPPEEETPTQWGLARQDLPTPGTSPRPDQRTTVARWTERRPQGLVQELIAAGLDRARACRVADLIRELHEDGKYGRAIDALRILLRGDMPILLERGEHEAALWEVLPKLLRATRDPFEIVQSLLVGAVCSGGVGEYAAFLECSEPGIKARHKDREGLYPVPGIHRPHDTRLAYARLDGYAGRDDSKGTAARGDARTLNSQTSPSPAERYGWNADRPPSRQRD